MKKQQADNNSLEHDRILYFLLSLTVALSALFIALEWNTEDELSADWEGLSPAFVEEQLLSLDLPETPLIAVPEPDVPSSVAQSLKEDIKDIKDVNDFEDFKEVDKITNKEEISSENLKENINQNQQPSTNAAELDDKVHTQADVVPEFSGGYAALVKYIYQNTQYPLTALNQRIQGKVWCSFIINRDGSVSDVKVEQGVYSFLDEEAVRVLKAMPAWQAGQIGGKPVRVKIYVPIVFKL
jgi:protein TonB